MKADNIRREILRVPRPTFLGDLMKVKPSSNCGGIILGNISTERAEPDPRKRVHFVMIILSGVVTVENQTADKLLSYVYARYGERAEEKAREIATNFLKRQKSKEIIVSVASRRSSQQDISKVSKLLVAE